MYGILNLLHPVGLDASKTCSVLGYCLLPVIGLAALNILFSMQGPIGLLLSLAAIGWATFAATRFVT
jgi:hypothetical protein